MLRPLALAAAFALSGCLTSSPVPYGGSYETGPGSLYRSAGAPDPFSLVAATGDPISEADADAFIARPIQIPRGARLAVLFAGTGSYLGSRADDVTARAAFAEALEATVLPSGAARTVSVLPSILTPAKPDIPTLRETGVRLQADGFLVVRISTGLLQNVRVFKDDQFRAFATVEAVLVDVRTGALPFTAVSTQQRTGTEGSEDLTSAEARLRLEREAAVAALRDVGAQLSGFLGEAGRTP